MNEAVPRTYPPCTIIFLMSLWIYNCLCHFGFTYLSIHFFAISFTCLSQSLCLLLYILHGPLSSHQSIVHKLCNLFTFRSKKVKQ
ncbi:hypothetical protein BGW80DRAFT_1205574 [Lactifluus volemus]|nr:hypothetical protein BGW80DRAFT_1205574 [Lactifluus volemus]